MLAGKNRLNKKEISELREEKLPVLQGKFLGLVFKPSEEKKFSLIVSQKISKKAVARNKIKRVFYDTIKENFFDLNGMFLFLAKKNIIEAQKEDLVNDLESLRKIISNL